MKIFRLLFYIACAGLAIQMCRIGGAALQIRMYAEIERVERGLREITHSLPGEP